MPGEIVPSIRVLTESATPPDGWDARIVEAPGGHLLQGTAWAAHRAAMGWQPRFLRFSDGHEALVLLRRRSPLPGALAYAPRGPAPFGGPPEVVARRVVALADWARTRGLVVLAVDPEIDESAAYRAVLGRDGFAPIEEIQPSRHRMVLRFAPAASEAEVLAAMAKSARNRIHRAQRSGIEVRQDPQGAFLERFGTLVDAAGEHKAFHFEAASGFLAWWRRLLATPYGRFYVALDGERLLGGLIVYVHGGRVSTAFSADDLGLRREHPGTMHLLRWEAIRGALAGGATSIELGGADTPGRRYRPVPGTPEYGLYEHKASFGATWAQSESAHEAVLRPAVHRAGLLLGRARRLARATGRRSR